ncbi:hypothetical protein GE09DRAFT_1209419 [Coniochaeta sp. 2T2.1]|nr:hypothetical protein GE09DRAFT_1209419 [Coniochaeta sp. 2T2.1]
MGCPTDLLAKKDQQQEMYFRMRAVGRRNQMDPLEQLNLSLGIDFAPGTLDKPGKGVAKLPGSSLEGETPAGAEPAVLPLGEELTGDAGLGSMVPSADDHDGVASGLPVLEGVGNVFEEPPLVGDAEPGADAELPEGAAPGAEPDMTPGVKLETTPEEDRSPGVDGVATPGAKLDMAAGVADVIDAAPGAAPEPATEGDIVGFESGAEPGAAPDSPADGEIVGPAPGAGVEPKAEAEPGAEPVPEGAPGACADASIGPPVDESQEPMPNPEGTEISQAKTQRQSETVEPIPTRSKQNHSMLFRGRKLGMRHCLIRSWFQVQSLERARILQETSAHSQMRSSDLMPSWALRRKILKEQMFQEWQTKMVSL